MTPSVCIRGRFKFFSSLLTICVSTLGALKAESLQSRLLNTGVVQLDRALPDYERTISASVVREAVFRHRRVFLTNAIIEGRLACENAVLDAALVFNGCHFKGDVDFGYATFKQAVSFSGSEFDGGVRMEFANAAQNVDLARTTFHGLANFGGFHCEGLVGGNGVQLDEKARLSFDLSDLRKGLAFMSSRFDGVFSCSKAHLQGLIAFVAVKFKQNAVFGLTVFDGMTLFLPGSSVFGQPNMSQSDPAGFDQDASFAMAEFKGYAIFAVDFKGWANFSGVRGDAELAFGFASSVPADWQLNKSITFSEPAHFTGLDAKRLSFGRVQFKKCVDFSGMTITEAARFEGEHYHQGNPPMFSGCALFRTVRIGGSLTFGDCGFADEADFGSATIGGDFSFYEESDQKESPPIFGGAARLDRVHVGGDLRFDSRLFAKALFLTSARVGGYVAFRGFFDKKAVPVTFRENVEFTGSVIKALKASGTIFEGPVQCQRTTIEAVDFRADPQTEMGPAVFNEDAVFSGSQWDWALFDGTTFKKKANFDAMDIKREARFQGTSFGAPLSFRATHCAGGLYLERARLSDATFRDAQFKSLSFSDPFDASKSAQFNGDVDLRGCFYDRVDADWQRLMLRIRPFDRQAYGQLQKALTAAGESDAAAEVYQARLVKEVGGRRWMWPLYIWPWVAAKPFQLVLASLFVVCCGWLLFLAVPDSYDIKNDVVLGSTGTAEPVVAGSATATVPLIVRVAHALALSVRAFIPFETAVAAHLAPRRPVGTTFALIIRLCGWALLAMLVAAASGLFRASP